jgi:hypothetical protein
VDGFEAGNMNNWVESAHINPSTIDGADQTNPYAGLWSYHMQSSGSQTLYTNTHAINLSNPYISVDWLNYVGAYDALGGWYFGLQDSGGNTTTFRFGTITLPGLYYNNVRKIAIANPSLNNWHEFRLEVDTAIGTIRGWIDGVDQGASLGNVIADYSSLYFEVVYGNGLNCYWWHDNVYAEAYFAPGIEWKRKRHGWLNL